MTEQPTPTAPEAPGTVLEATRTAQDARARVSATPRTALGRLRAAERVDACRPLVADLRAYQASAAQAVFAASGRTVQAWHWISTECGVPTCARTEHMRWTAPLRLHYPAQVCVYCGLVAWTRDHLLPVSSTGKALRRHVLTVPACAECNSMIGDRGTANIDTRRQLAHEGIRRKYRRKLETAVWSPGELGEMGRMLRTHIEGAVAQKRLVLERLGWPEDPAFDLRALEQSGIEDPYATGLLGKEAHR